MPDYEVYSRDNAVSEFFAKTCTTRDACDKKAKELVGGTVVPVEVQGVCSYTVYAGPNLQHVVQFRLDSLKLPPKTAALARQIYGSLAPDAKYHGVLGDEEKGDKESVLVYVMDRMKGIPHLDFILAYGHPENSPSSFASRKNLISGIARFMAMSWNAPQEVAPDDRKSMGQLYRSDLQLLLLSLPERFHSIIQCCIDELDLVFSLPMVLLHRDFGTSNVLVDEKSCDLAGVIDWAEAEICPFGQNLHSLEAFTGALHLQDGWRRYEDYKDLQTLFWDTFSQEIGEEAFSKYKRAIEISRATGLLRSRGFTKRLANLPPTEPIREDAKGRYNMMYLDGFLINPHTKFLEL